MLRPETVQDARWSVSVGSRAAVGEGASQIYTLLTTGSTDTGLELLMSTLLPPFALELYIR